MLKPMTDIEFRTMCEKLNFTPEQTKMLRKNLKKNGKLLPPNKGS